MRKVNLDFSLHLHQVKFLSSNSNLIFISSRYNVCCETLEETIERLEIIRTEHLLPNLENPPVDFEPMTKYIAKGLWCFNPFDPYLETIFMIKRSIGVPNFFYFNCEIPESYDRNNLEIYKQSYPTRTAIWLSIMTRQFLTKVCILRWILNFVTFTAEFFIRYFPVLAFIRFGFRKAYVKDEIR